MENSVFISYRRNDSQHASIALAEALKWAFVDGQVFFDRSSIKGADVWPDLIKTSLSNAKIVLVVIGGKWLKVCDEHGRRRIDHHKDWVRLELQDAIATEKCILPILLEDTKMPAPEALDSDLAPLVSKQSLQLRASSWESDLYAIIERISNNIGVSKREVTNGHYPTGTRIPRPDRTQSTRPVLPPEKIRDELDILSVWNYESNYHPWGIAGRAEEISRVYEFSSFEAATQFMASVSNNINRWDPPHHPRWQNQWRVVTVWFTTWDVGCRLTDLDLLSAERMEKLYVDYVSQQ